MSSPAISKPPTTDWPDAPTGFHIPVIPEFAPSWFGTDVPGPDSVTPLVLRRRVFRRDARALAALGGGPVCYREVLE